MNETSISAVRGAGTPSVPRTTDARARDPTRYDRVVVWLHWSVGLLLFVEIAFGLLLDEIAPRGTSARAGVINLHKSLGIVVGLLVIARIGWRLCHATPPWPTTMSPRQQRAANAGHLALYACMLVAPLAGYLGSNFSRHGVRFFGIARAPWGPDWPAAYSFLVGVHDASTYLLLVLIVGHVVMALKHAFFDRDGVFARIAP